MTEPPPPEPSAATQWHIGVSPVQASAIFVMSWCILDFVAGTILAQIESGFLGAVYIGVICGQFALLTIWSVVGPGSWVARRLLAMSAVSAWYVSLILGVAVRHGPPQIGLDAFMPLLSLPLVLLCAEFPLWVVRLIRGWQIRSLIVGKSGPVRDAQRFTLGNLFGATASIAVALGLARVTFAGSEFGQEEFGRGGLIFFAIVAMFASGFALIVTIPSLWAALGARDSGNGCLAMVVYPIALWILASVLIVVLSAGSRGPPPEVLAGAACLIVSTLATIYGHLLLARKMGYVLDRPRSRVTRQPPA